MYFKFARLKLVINLKNTYLINKLKISITRHVIPEEKKTNSSCTFLTFPKYHGLTWWMYSHFRVVKTEVVKNVSSDPWCGCCSERHYRNISVTGPQ